jgi:signal transduction histidine kinase
MKNSDISILLIDDEEKITSRLSRILEKEEYRVDIALNGATAIEKMKKEHFDIAVTDLNMPDINGFEIMEFINLNNYGTLPLVLTGYASVEGAIQAIKCGAYDFIEKPIDAPTLKLTIKRAAERIHLQRENTKNLEELRKLNDLKNEFLTVVSHDLRSPLSTIGGYVNYLLKKGNVDATQSKYLNIIKDISDNLYSLVNELLDISRIEVGIMQLDKESADLAELINTSINNFILLSIDKNNKIEFHNNLKNSMITMDRMKIMQVMNNLINNAVKFTENGSITIKADENGSRVVISVEDTGVGISEGEISSLFDKYSYYHKRGTRGEGGSGLGLVICRKFVEIHGGSIRVESTHGRGSKFEFDIPVE